MKSIFKSKSTKIVITLLFCIITIFFLSTIAYSAFSSTMNITGLAHSRVEADTRITNFTVDEIVNATSSYEEFGKDHISTSISSTGTECTEETTDIICSYHYSGKIFSNTSTIIGGNTMPNYAGTGTMSGNNGNRYAKITLLELK